MILLLGVRTYVRTLAILTLVCGQCGNPAAHRLVERLRRFTLFFIPLFPVGTSRAVTCTFCGQSTAVTKEQSAEYVAIAARAQAPAAEQIPLPPQPPAAP